MLRCMNASWESRYAFGISNFRCCNGQLFLLLLWCPLQSLNSCLLDRDCGLHQYSHFAIQKHNCYDINYHHAVTALNKSVAEDISAFIYNHLHKAKVRSCKNLPHKNLWSLQLKRRLVHVPQMEFVIKHLDYMDWMTSIIRYSEDKHLRGSVCKLSAPIVFAKDPLTGNVDLAAPAVQQYSTIYV